MTHTYRFLQHKHNNELPGHPGLQKLLRHWEEKSTATDEDWMNDTTKALYLEMLEDQRKYMSDLNNDPHVDEEMIREQLYLIDLEEERIRML